MTAPEIREVVASWTDDPVVFGDDLLGSLTFQGWQRDAAGVVARSRRTAIRGVRGSRKTGLQARLALWGLSQQMRVWAGFGVASQGQNFSREIDHILRESPRLRSVFPNWGFYPGDGRLETGTPHVVLTTHSAEAGAAWSESAHHPTGDVLCLLDESKSISREVRASTEGMLIGERARLVATSTAGNGLSWFDAAFGVERDKWDACLSIGVEQARWLAGKRDEMRRLLGPADPLYLAQWENIAGGGLGGEGFFDSGRLLAAVGRELPRDSGRPVVWALDVARFGRDSTVLARRHGGVVLPVMRWQKAALTETTGRVIQFLRNPTVEKPAAIIVDAAGVGGGVADQLREQLDSMLRYTEDEGSIMVYDHIGGSRAEHAPEFWANAKTEAAATLSGLLERGEVSLPPGDPALIAELSSYERTVASNGKARIVDPSNRSPDSGDATLMLFANDAIEHGEDFVTTSYTRLGL